MKRLSFVAAAVTVAVLLGGAATPVGAKSPPKHPPAHQTLKTIAQSERQAKARDAKAKATAPSSTAADVAALQAAAATGVSRANAAVQAASASGNTTALWSAIASLYAATATQTAANQVAADLAPPPPPPPTTTTTTQPTTTTTTAPVQHAPPAVSGLKATATGTSVVLSWTNNGTAPSQTDGNDIYRNGTKIAWPLLTNTYTDATPGTGTVIYGVTAYNGAGEGPETTTSVTVSPTTTTTTQPNTTSTTTPNTSGLIHPRGVYNGSVQSALSLSSALGFNPIQGYSYYCDGSSWSSIGACSPPGGLPAGTPLLVGLNLEPGGVGNSAVSGNLSTFRSVANNFKGYNGTVVFRLGWEMDGNWFSWGNGVNGNTPASFASATGLVIPAMKAIMPAAQFDFSDNMGSASLSTLTQFIGNNASLWTYIGGDHYATAGSTGSGSMSNMTAAVTLSHNLGKPFSIGEWGLNGTDSPSYIAAMCQVITNPAAASSANNWPSYTVGPTSYFSAALQIDSVITNKPNSLAAFKADCG